VNPTRRVLLAVLVLLAVGGCLLHFRVHPTFLPDKEHPGATIFRPSYVAATALPLLDLVLVTLLFTSRRTAAYGYLLNGLLVIYGTVLMGHFSIAMLAPKGPSPMDWVLKSTLADIAIAWGDFFAGKALYDSWMREG
jgi:hypothetical protein